jgi:uncharacterized protein YecE (DUF72 family)
MKTSELVYIGTSGWDYPEWRSLFYPDDLPRENWLTYYTNQFPSLEINHSFYQLPEPETLKQWRSQVPKEFRFAVKASRYITHNKKLKDPQEPVKNFMARVTVLEDNLGPILFQLPPHWHCNQERLEQFLQVLPTEFEYSFEFRDRTWHCPEIYDTLARYGAAFCIFDLQQDTTEKIVTAGHIYVRLHGTSHEPYRGHYSQQDLAGWAGAFASWTKQGKTIYCYFNNDKDGCAPHDARSLQQMVSR